MNEAMLIEGVYLAMVVLQRALYSLSFFCNPECV